MLWLKSISILWFLLNRQRRGSFDTNHEYLHNIINTPTLFMLSMYDNNITIHKTLLFLHLVPGLCTAPTATPTATPTGPPLLLQQIVRYKLPPRLRSGLLVKHRQTGLEIWINVSSSIKHMARFSHTFTKPCWSNGSLFLFCLLVLSKIGSLDLTIPSQTCKNK